MARLCLLLVAAAVVAGLCPAPPAAATTEILCDGVPATLVGTRFDDLLIGTPERDVIVARNGNDEIRGGGGDDLICAGNGADLVTGGPGNDIILAGRGADVVYGEGGRDTVHGHGGPDLIYGGVGADILRGGPFDDVLLGGPGRDTLSGGPGRDALSGGDLADVLEGDADDDSLAGGGGSDHLYGGPGSDWMAGEEGIDLLIGDGGTDWCRTNGGSFSCEHHDSTETAWIGSTHATRFGGIMRTALVLQEGCTDPTAIRRAAVIVRVIPPSAGSDLVPVIDHLEDATAYCDGDGTDWAASMEAANEALAVYVGLAAPPLGPEGDPFARAAAAATGTVLLNDALYDRLRGTGDGLSEFWLSASHAGHARDLQVAADTGIGYDVLLVGSSMMIDAGDPRLFETLDGRSAFNAAIKGVGPEKIEIWLREFALERADPDLVVYGVAPREFRSYPTADGSCTNSVTRMIKGRTFRDEAFAPVAELGGLPWQTLFFGDPADPEPEPAPPGHTVYRRDHHPLGDRSLYLPDRGPWAGMDSVAEWATDYELCDDRVATIGGTVAWLDGLGVDVVVVAMPISDARATLFGGRDEVDAILAAAASEILDAGAAAFLDLSETIPSGLFRDITHVNEDGKEAFTTLLVGELTALGL